MNLTPDMVAMIDDMFAPCDRESGGCGHALRAHLASGGGTGGCARRSACPTCDTGSKPCSCNAFKPSPDALAKIAACEALRGRTLP